MLAVELRAGSSTSSTVTSEPNPASQRSCPSSRAAAASFCCPREMRIASRDALESDGKVGSVGAAVRQPPLLVARPGRGDSFGQRSLRHPAPIQSDLDRRPQQPHRDLRNVRRERRDIPGAVRRDQLPASTRSRSQSRTSDSACPALSAALRCFSARWNLRHWAMKPGSTWNTPQSR